MSETPGPNQSDIERILSLCREVERAVQAATADRQETADALALLKHVQRKSNELCEEVERLVNPQRPRRSADKQSRR